MKDAVRDLIAAEPPPHDKLPGLHFGEAGVAVAVVDAIAAGDVRRSADVDRFLERSLSGTLDWPDITHGAAGQGIAALYSADRLKDPSLAEHAHRCAAFLVAAQRRDGSWKLPPGIDGLSGQTLTGFAHGAAGMTFFLAEYACRFRDAGARRATRLGAAWLVNRAIPAGGGARLEWAYGTHTRRRWHWWCHGGPGIALTFLKLYEETQSARYADLARRALRAHPMRVRHHNLTACHGLAGLGEIYLEAARVLGEREWYDRAAVLSGDLLLLAHDTGLGTGWLAEDPHQATPDLMIGYGGVVHFLLRVRLAGAAHAPGFPLLLDPARG